MKHAYLLLILAGVLATGCKKSDKTAPERKLDIFDSWSEERYPGGPASSGNSPRAFYFAPDMSYVYFAGGSSNMESERGIFTITQTGDPDSCVLKMTPNNGNPARTLEIRFSADKYTISITEFGKYRRQGPECNVIL